MSHQWTSYSLADLPQIAEELLRVVPDARLFGFWGNLGAGKTTFIKSLCAHLGVKEPVTSPTFNIVNTYTIQTEEIHHFDFYRMDKEEETEAIGIYEYWDSGDYCFMEWPERILNILPEELWKVELVAKSPSERIITLEEFIP